MSTLFATVAAVTADSATFIFSLGSDALFSFDEPLGLVCACMYGHMHHTCGCRCRGRILCPVLSQYSSRSLLLQHGIRLVEVGARVPILVFRSLPI